MQRLSRCSALIASSAHAHCRNQLTPLLLLHMHACLLFILSQDPAIKQMAEQIANDPSFQGLTSQLQESMSGMLGGGGAAPAEAAASLPMPDPANFDPTKYMQAMSGMFQNPQFMQMAEKLGQAIIQVRRWIVF